MAETDVCQSHTASKTPRAAPLGTGLRAVFIGGCPRSGTTLLGSMLGSHSGCLCVPESGFKMHAMRAFDPQRGNAAELLRAFQDEWRFKLWGIEAPELPLSLAEMPPELAFASAVECLVRRYGEHVAKPASRLWVDHTPSNTQYGPTLLRLFPGAKLIHIVRDGRAVAASILPLDWGPNTIDEAARWWIEQAAFGLAAESWGAGRDVLRVRYEDLLLQPEATLQRLAAFLELDYQPAMAEADGFRVPQYSAQQHALIGRRPDASRVRSWQDDLTPRQIEIFEFIAAGMLEYLGYSPQFGLKARKISGLERQAARLYAVCRRRILNRFHFKGRKRANSGAAGTSPN